MIFSGASEAVPAWGLPLSASEVLYVDETEGDEDSGSTVGPVTEVPRAEQGFAGVMERTAETEAETELMEKRATRQSAATLAPPQKRYNAADKQPYNEQGERVYCVCRTTDDGRFMLQCDGCLDWYHGVCVGITERQAKTIGKYSCPYCEQKKNDAIMAALASGANGLIHSNEEYQQGPESIVTAIPTTNRRPPTSRPAPLRRISAATTTTSSSTVPRQANKPLTEPDVGPTSMAWIHDKIRSQVRKSFGETLRGVLADLQAEGITPHSVAQAGERGVKEWVDVTELAGQMEDELFDFTSDGVKGFPRSCGDKYKAKFRSLQYNLKDKKNSHLRARLLSAHLPPHALVRLEAHELANEEIKRQSEAIRLQSIADALKPVVDLGELKKTHKGDVEVVQELEVAVPIPTTAALNGVKRRESPTANEMEETEETEREVVVPAGTGIAGIMAAARASGIAARVAASKPAKVDILDDLLAKIEKPPSPSGAVKRGSSMEALPADGLDSKKGRFEEVSEVSVVGSGWDNLAVSDSWASFDAAGDDMAWIRSPREGEEDMTKPPTREVSPPLETGSTVWTGLVRMPQVGKFNGSCVQIAGRSLSSQTTWEALLPPTVFIEGRIDVNRSQAYITQQRHSSSKEVVAVQFLASSSPSDSEAVGGFKTLLDYFYEKNRHAVVGQKLMAVRDMYLVPVPRGESVPPFLAALTKFNVVDKCDVSDRLFGVLVLDKTFLIELVEKEKREALNRKQPEKMKTSTMTGSLEANKKVDTNLSTMPLPTPPPPVVSNPVSMPLPGSSPWAGLFPQNHPAPAAPAAAPNAMQNAATLSLLMQLTQQNQQRAPVLPVAAASNLGALGLAGLLSQFQHGQFQGQAHVPQQSSVASSLYGGYRPGRDPRNA